MSHNGAKVYNYKAVDSNAITQIHFAEEQKTYNTYGLWIWNMDIMHNSDSCTALPNKREAVKQCACNSTNTNRPIYVYRMTDSGSKVWDLIPTTGYV